MTRLLNMTARTFAKHFLALFMLFAVCAPYVHAAVEMGQHEECGMEMCKRAGKCCCRRTVPGKPHWVAQDICHSGAAQIPGVFTSPAAVLSAANDVARPTQVATTPVPLQRVTVPAALLAIIRFQRPPPSSF